MSETTEVTPDSTAVEQEPLGEAGKKALDAERRNARTATRERDALAAKLADIENVSKTESQKVVERAEAAERGLAEAQATIVRLQVAAEKGLTPAQAKRLVGTTREELEADADELLATFTPAEPAAVTATSLDLGARVTPMALNGDPLEAALKRKLGIV